MLPIARKRNGTPLQYLLPWISVASLGHGLPADLAPDPRISAEVVDGSVANLTDELGATPLHHAALVGDRELISSLLDAGAAVNARDIEGATPSSYASRAGETEALRLLQQRGGRVFDRRVPVALDLGDRGDWRAVTGVSVTVFHGGGFTDYQKRSVAGLDLGLLGTSKLLSEGAAMSPTFIFHESANGVAVGGLFAAAEKANGIMVGGFLGGGAAVNGVAIGGFGAGGEEINGLALSPGTAVGMKSLNGVAVGGLGVYAREANGLIIGGLGVSAGEANGVVIGAGCTVVDEVTSGVQVSLINSTRQLFGVQLGAFNRAEEIGSGFQLGLLNFAGNGFLPVFPLINFSIGRGSE